MSGGTVMISGTCSMCGRAVELDKRGRIAAHRNLRKGEVLPSRYPPVAGLCHGTRRLPRQDDA